MISLDTETTGIDFWHGARPYFVTVASRGKDGKVSNRWWEWRVDPLTRAVTVPADDELEVQEAVRDASSLVLQNAKFDAHALHTADIIGSWPWRKTHDTLMASHLLATNQPHDLTALAIHYLGVNLQPLEDALEEAVKDCRSYCRSHLCGKKVSAVVKHSLFDDPPTTETKGWAIAAEGRPDMPSAKEKTWKFDGWLPCALADKLGKPDDHPWRTVLRDYSNADSAATLLLWSELEVEIRKRGLWRIYLERMAVLPVVWQMEEKGITLSGSRLSELTGQYRKESAAAAGRCVSIAKELGARLEMPRSGNNGSLTKFCFEVLKLPPVKHSVKTGVPSLDKESLERWRTELTDRTQLEFVESLAGKRGRDTAISYMENYRRFCIPSRNGQALVIHPNYNPTGTDTLRFSSNNPNAQNVKKAEIDGHSLRYCFGPVKGREWWSFDAKNLELRIPAYKAGEEEFIRLFERPDEPPYFGSNHLMVAHLLHPKLFDDCRDDKGEVDGRIFKKRYESTWYAYTKRGNFSLTCLPLTSEVLTRDGWKRWWGIKEGQEVLGYDQETDRLEWTIVRGKIWRRSAGLVKMSNNHFEAVSTWDHRWAGRRRTGRGRTKRYVNEFFTTRDISYERSIVLSAPLNEEPLIKISEAEAALIGFVYGDGCIERGKYVGNNGQAGGRKVKFRVRIFQRKEKGIRYIEEVLSRWGGRFTRYKGPLGTPAWALKSEDARELWRRVGLFETNKKDGQKEWERFVLGIGTKGRRAFLEGVFASEGTMSWTGRGEKRKIYYQNRGGFADAIKLCIFLSGQFPTESVRKDYYGSNEVSLSISGCKPLVTGRRMIYEELGSKPVWCLKTDLETFVTKQESGLIMITGNCGAVEESGTADRAFRVKGAHRLIKQKMSKMAELSHRLLKQAEQTGYVETVPDKSVDPERGFPILCARTEWGKVLPTTPFSYWVQGTAMWWMTRCMIEVQRFFDALNAGGSFGGRVWPGGYFIAIQVHDELDVDMPSSRGKSREQWHYNLPIAREVQRIMEQCGADLGVPTPASVEFCADNWAEGVSV